MIPNPEFRIKTVASQYNRTLLGTVFQLLREFNTKIVLMVPRLPFKLPQSRNILEKKAKQPNMKMISWKLNFDT
jgi:hypothetical protein